MGLRPGNQHNSAPQLALDTPATPPRFLANGLRRELAGCAVCRAWAAPIPLKKSKRRERRNAVVVRR